ncbi:MAG: signal peptidase I [Spirochaetota bacterium]
MKSEIIKSESSLKRYRTLAFALSFVFTGLGQIYNGDLSRGIVFFIVRILSLLFIPVYLIIQKDFSVLFVLTAAGLHILVWLISPIEAMQSAKGQNAYNLKKYNSVSFYLLYTFVNSVLVILSVFLMTSFFSIEKIETDNMNPALLKNDYILVNKYAAGHIDIGNIILFSSKNGIIEGRIIGRDGDTVSKKQNYFYINDGALSYNIFSKSELTAMGLTNSEDLFFEVNGKRRYPVKLKPGKDKNAPFIKPVTLGSNELFIAFDNRSKDDSFEVIKTDSVIGRAEGIIYSKNISRIFNRLFLAVE